MTGRGGARRRGGGTDKSGGKSGGRPGTFRPGADSKRGRGPKKGAPNAGRPPIGIREVMRLALESRISVLTAIADGEPVVRLKVRGGETETLVSASISNRLSAIEVMAKCGLGTQMETPVDGNGEKVGAQVIVPGDREFRF